MAAKILARLLVVSGPAYMSKFIEKTGGVIVMQHRLKRWWNLPAMWSICFAIFFGVDLAQVDFGRSFDLFSLLELFSSDNEVTVAYPEMLLVLTSMLQSGLMNVTRDQSDPDSPMTSPSSKSISNFSRGGQNPTTLSMNTIAPGKANANRENFGKINTAQVPQSLQKKDLLPRLPFFAQSRGFWRTYIRDHRISVTLQAHQTTSKKCLLSFSPLS